MTDTQQPTGFSFPVMEHDMLSFWQTHQVFEQSLAQTKDGKPYVFYDGPPFATGLPHHGHLLASTLKDIIPRYFTMQGRYVSRRFGWDCHGVPVEYEIDKQFGKPTDEVVKELGISGYNQACREVVQRYAKEWRSTITRIGRWVDFDNDYKTMDTDFMESVWWVFKQLWDKDLIYQGTKVVPFSTALGTVLSNFEAGSNYQDVQDPAITVLLKLEEGPAYLAIWTTTPWTLPSNLGVCVGADIDYVLVEDQESKQQFYLASDRLPAYEKGHELEVIERLTGADLVGRSYQPLFDYFSELKTEGCFAVLADGYVSTSDGTGLVHMAPAFGEDDYRIMRAAGIETFVCPVDNKGCFTEEVTDFAGQYVKDADKAIIKNLKSREVLYQQQTLVHSYPFCPRSDTPLIYKTIPSWYVGVEQIKDRLLAANEQIHWVPGHLKSGRFGKWLEGARDWAISRNRVWGTPLPIWINDQTDQRICIGSIDELEEYSGQRVSDLHRDFVDDITFTRPGEAGTYRRITEVLDCWFESGSMPYAQVHYPFENQAEFEQSFPAEFIAEGLDQTRGWFYLLTVLSVALFDKPAFKHVIVNGIVMAENGKKMSKRLKNYTAPDQLMETFGADALRLYLINSGLVKGEEQRFSDEGVRDTVRRTLLPWYNAFKFLHTYAEVDGWQPDEHMVESDNIVDQWILSRKESLISGINQHMAEYKLYLVVPELLRFIDDLTNWYIRLNRGRFWGDGLPADKCMAYSTLYQVIHDFSIAMAPFAPFLSEYIYQQLLALRQDQSQAPMSVHLCQYPQASTKQINDKLEQAVGRMQQIILLGRGERNQHKLKIKQPLARLTIIHKDAAILKAIEPLADYIQRELNIKTLNYDGQEDAYIELYTKPNSPVLGKRYGREFGKIRQLIESMTAEQINQLEQQGSIELAGEMFSVGDVLIYRQAKAGVDAVSNRYISIQLDRQLTPELLSEGLAREVVSRIQKARKEQGLHVADRINLRFKTDEALTTTLLTHQDYIKQETLALSLQVDDAISQGITIDVDDHRLVLVIAKVG